MPKKVTGKSNVFRTDSSLSRVTIDLPPELVTQLASTIRYEGDPNSIDESGIPEAYLVVYRYLRELGPDRVDFGRVLWLSQANFINSDDGPASNFLRTYTEYAAAKDNVPFTPQKMQETSNRIGRFVLRNILETGELGPQPSSNEEKGSNDRP